MSAASCTESDASIAYPVERHDITSDWSPKIESACVAMARAVGAANGDGLFDVSDLLG